MDTPIELTKQNKRVRHKDLIDSYSIAASSYDKSRFPWEKGPLGKIEREEISKVLKGECLLECGIGTGRNAISFGRSHFFVGCDISKDMIMYCKAKMRLKKIDAELILADAENLPFKNEIFDSIICSRTFKFFQEPLGFLGNALRVLRKGGRCVITFGWRDSFWFRIAMRFGLIKLYQDEYYYANDILHLSHKAAFANTSIRPVGNLLFGFYSFLWFTLYPTPFANIFRYLPLRLGTFILKIGRQWFCSYILVLEEK